MLPVNVVSVIIPVFNRQDWLQAAVDSVLQQDCGLEHLQVVLVDDGSTDASPAICDVYEARYPNNVTVVHQENAGVAAAFNTGLDVARGDVIGFLGSDDYLSLDSLREVKDFFNEHWDECDVATIKIEMTGARSGPHWNNKNRFNKSRIIDVATEWNHPHLHSGGAFVKAETLLEYNIRFDPVLFMTEDATLLTQVIIRRMSYGVLHKPTYFNRRYAEGAESQVSSSHFKPEFYSDILEHSYWRMFKDSIELYGRVPKYVQAICAYDLMFRFRANLSMLDAAERVEYENRIRDLLQQIEVGVLIRQSGLVEQRLNMLNLRQNGRLKDDLTYYQGVYSLENCRVYSVNPRKRVGHRPPICTFHSFELKGDSLAVAGTISAVQVSDNMRFIIRVGKKVYPIDLMESFADRPSYLSSNIDWAPSFRATVRFRPGDVLRVLTVIDTPDGEQERYRCDFRMGRATRFAGDASFPYYRRQGRDVVRLVGAGSLQRFHLKSALHVVRAEEGFLRRASEAGAPKDVLSQRRTASLVRPTRRQIWLMMDHKLEAGDNAEALFRYLCAHPEHGVHPVLTLASTAPDFAELRGLGEVVEPNSRAYFRRYLAATVVLNSAADEYVLNPLGANHRYLGDRTPPVSVFLQHGVTKDDQSAWLNWTRKGFDVVVASATSEYRAFVDGSYAYTPEQVALTGMPRFDRLVSSPQKLVVIAPTWRKALSGQLNAATGRVQANRDFADSLYFKQWQDLITDGHLNEALRSRGYRGLFVLHPSHAAEIGKFQAGESITIASYPYNYRKLFEEGSILVTDYSSVAFDFAYLRKPVVYAQQDRDDFFGGHLYKPGYFSYTGDGFGPVADNHESLVESIVDLIENDCLLEDKYRQRVDRFFPFEDQGNSARLTEFVKERVSDLTRSGRRSWLSKLKSVARL